MLLLELICCRPCIYVLNKIDAISMEELDLLDQVPHYVPISAKDEWNLVLIISFHRYFP